MFEKNTDKEAQKVQLKSEQESREHTLQMEAQKISLLEKIAIFVEQEMIENKEQKEERKKFTFNNTQQIFETKGYRYNTFIVSEYNRDTVIEIEYDLERFTMMLSSGFNKLNLPNGCLVNTQNGSSITVSLVLSKQEF